MAKKSNKTINTEEKLVERLNVDSVEEIHGDKINELFKIHNEIDDTLFVKIVEGLHIATDDLKKLATAVSDMYDETYKLVVGDNPTINAYKGILDFVKKESQRKDLSFEELKKYTDEMKEIAAKISEEERTKEELNKELQKQKVSMIIILAIIIAITVLMTVAFIMVPGVIAETLTIIIGIICIIIVIMVYSHKKNSIKIKYSNDIEEN